MANDIFLKKDFLKEAGITEKILLELELNQLIKPAGFAENNVPFYTNASLEQLSTLVSLINVGYEISAIKKIVKKIGLPNSTSIQKKEKNVAKFITISDLAKEVGVSVRTIKHWEEKGIIESEMRSAGGFRLYSETYIYMCQLIRDLQLFSYSLEEIKTISDYFRDFLLISSNSQHYSKIETHRRLDSMNKAIVQLFSKMNLLKDGISRWEALLKTKQKEIQTIKNKNAKRKIAKEKIKED
jgi:DNA-binding transcriptional MerR regulator